MPNAKPSDDIEPLRDVPFAELSKLADPALRLVVWLIQNKQLRQLEERTGLRLPRNKQEAEKAKDGLYLPVLLQLATKKGGPRIAEALHEVYRVPRAYSAALERNRKLRYVTGRLPLEADIFRGSADSLVQAINGLRKLGVRRVSLGAPGQPSRGRPSLIDIGLPASRRYKNKALTGKDVVVGIIDDGCAFAHNNFLKPRAAGAGNPAQSRILYLWDQGREALSAGWQAAAGFYGCELNQQAIDTALQANQSGDLVNEDAVYAQLRYRMREVATHGTHVMDIAAGNGQALMGIKGVAPDADIIFVQLPTTAIEGGATALAAYIVEGVEYIFERAMALKKPEPAVVNISYGGYDGPHDGTSDLEQALDGLLAEPDRAVVLAAGNGFEERCHAARTVHQNSLERLHWIVQPEDPTANDLEIWYEDTSQLYVRLISPGPAIDPAGWIQLGQSTTAITSGGRAIGYIEHLASATGNTANQIVIHLNGTYADDPYSPTPIEDPAPPGTWIVELMHQSGPDADVHAWIWRDDAGRPREGRRRQSRFRPDDALPASTISGWATGQLTISAGAYNTATQEICRYSACGPTRATNGNAGRPKPEIYAPAEEDVRGRGVLSASALSARPTRMNGTSAAAPHITGLIALMFEYAQKHA